MFTILATLFLAAGPGTPDPAPLVRDPAPLAAAPTVGTPQPVAYSAPCLTGNCPTARTFTPIPYHAGHQCPQCGRAQFIVSGYGPGPGQHVHTCAVGHSWYH